MKLRLYRTASDLARTTFVAGVDPQIPLVPGAEIICRTTAQVDEILGVAHDSGLTVEVWCDTSAWTVVVGDAREAA